MSSFKEAINLQKILNQDHADVKQSFKNMTRLIEEVCDMIESSHKPSPKIPQPCKEQLFLSHIDLIDTILEVIDDSIEDTAFDTEQIEASLAHCLESIARCRACMIDTLNNT